MRIVLHSSTGHSDPATGDSLDTVIIGGTELFREGLRRLLAPRGFEVVADEAREAAGREMSRPPAVVILCAPPRVELTAAEVGAARARYPGSTIVCLCDVCREDQVVPMLEDGAAAILLRAAGSDTLVQTLELALMGHRIVPRLPPPPPAEHAAPESPAPADPPPEAVSASGGFRPSTLEVKIIASLVRGESNRTIARQLIMPEGRVKGHVKAILRKMRVRNRTQAAIWGMTHRLGQDTLSPIPGAGHPAPPDDADDLPDTLSSDDGERCVGAPYPAAPLGQPRPAPACAAPLL